jgi:hypothetical protein
LSGWSRPKSIFISSETALQTVRLRHFLLDCRSIAGDPQELEAWSEQERQAAHHHLEETY